MTIWNNPTSSLPLLPTPHLQRPEPCLMTHWWSCTGTIGEAHPVSEWMTYWTNEWNQVCPDEGVCKGSRLTAKLGLPSLGRKSHSFWSVLALSYFNPETDGLCVLCCPAFQGIRIRLSSRALLGCCLAQWSHSFTPLPCAHRDDSAISITTLIAHT